MLDAEFWDTLNNLRYENAHFFFKLKRARGQIARGRASRESLPQLINHRLNGLRAIGRRKSSVGSQVHFLGRYATEVVVD